MTEGCPCIWGLRSTFLEPTCNLPYDGGERVGRTYLSLHRIPWKASIQKNAESWPHPQSF